MPRWLTQVKRNPTKAIKTATIYLALVCLGMNAGVRGPTLLDLKTQVQRTLSEVSTIMPLQAGGYAIGSFAMGISFKRVNILLYGAIAMLIAAASAAAVPHLMILDWMRVCYFFAGVFLGAFEAGSNVFILHMWGRETGPFMQAFDFSWGAGTLLATLVVQPFLLETEESEEQKEIRALGNETAANITDPVYGPSDLMLVYPYSILGGIFVVCSICFAILFAVSPDTPEHESRIKSNHPETSEGQANDAYECSSSDKVDGRFKTLQSIDMELAAREKQRKEEKFYKIFIILLMMLFGHVSYGLELILGQFLVTFVYTAPGLRLSKTRGTRITSTFWGTFTFWRLLAIFYIEYIGHEINLLSSLVVILIGNAILVPFGASTESCVWIGSAVIGLGASSMWPSMFGYMEDHFKVSSRTASAVIVSATVGDFVFPFIITFFIDSDPHVFLWAVLACSLTLALDFALMVLIARTKLREGREKRKRIDS